jgi:putative transcriptional regulator
MRKPLSYKVVNNLAKLLKQEQMKRWVQGGEKFLLSEIEKEVGEHCGVRREAIYSIKRGKSNAGLPIAFKIAEYFQVGIEDIFYLDSDESQLEIHFPEMEEEHEEEPNFGHGEQLEIF